MPLSVADLATLGDTPITIRSTAFPNVYLRMDGSGVTSTTGPGGGKVNCQFGATAYEKFKVRAQTDGSYAFESAAFPKVYLRMNGTGVSSNLTNGGGTVNCQFNASGPGAYEKYKVSAQTDGSLSFESAAFPKVYLRLNGTGVTTNTSTGGGTVNCQWDANGGIHEKFFLNMADQDINFVIQRQEQTWWCWDAATVSVATFYNSETEWTQCTLANDQFGRNDCCVAAGQVSPCNWGNWPDQPLRRVEHLTQRLDRALTSVELGAELAKSAPVVVNIDWPDPASGHIVVLHGRSLRDGVEWVKVADPWEGNSEILMRYDDFRNRYPDNGTWNVSYKTQP